MGCRQQDGPGRSADSSAAYVSDATLPARSVYGKVKRLPVMLQLDERAPSHRTKLRRRNRDVTAALEITFLKHLAKNAVAILDQAHARLYCSPGQKNMEHLVSCGGSRAIDFEAEPQVLSRHASRSSYRLLL